MSPKVNVNYIYEPNQLHQLLILHYLVIRGVQKRSQVVLHGRKPFPFFPCTTTWLEICLSDNYFVCMCVTDIAQREIWRNVELPFPTNFIQKRPLSSPSL